MARPHCILAALSVFVLAPFARADKLWLKTDAPATQAEGQAPQCLVGVVSAETAEEYTLRMPGGTMVLAKSAVARIERDGLTLEQIEASERDMHKAAAEADSKRSRDLARWTDAAHKQRAAAQAEEPAEPQDATLTIDFKGLLAPITFRRDLPLLSQLDLEALRATVEAFLRAELQRLGAHPRAAQPADAAYDAVLRVHRTAPAAEPVQVQDAAATPAQGRK